ncbi:dienelactone hydrolase family protein [Streptacidiphilus rugosus]|uniref:dienelactone hydrolase family protein n=1 Tax=Streptacidiphilus rugosus TaxID=405783 RepID=UPI00055A36FA|nr:dienelactone hydrolase family protein [Streptacidiphilus rugosus]
MTAVQGSTVEIRTADGTADAYFTHPDDGAAHPSVLFYMDAFGLRPQLRKMADRLAAAGYTVLAPNVFYRSARTPVIELPDFIGGENREGLFAPLMPMIATLTPDAAVSDADAYLTWLAARPESDGRPVGVTGYCMGARLALLTAGRHSDRVAAAAGFHGGRLFTDAPDSPHLVAPDVTAELYFGHADDDGGNTPEQQAGLAKALTEAGVRHTAELYPGAQHGYTMADTDKYDEQAAERHWAALLDLFGRNL